MSSSQPEFYQESIRSMRTLSGCIGECNLQPWVRNSWFAHLKHIAYIPMVRKSLVCTCQTCQIKLMGVGHYFVWCYGYSIYISYITYPIIPTQTFVIKFPSLYLFSHISF